MPSFLFFNVKQTVPAVKHVINHPRLLCVPVKVFLAKMLSFEIFVVPLEPMDETMSVEAVTAAKDVIDVCEDAQRA